ncbi:MAG: hypothetical protein COT92_00605 [Candidatus Doudnabacteria bacterium CG10_big_fil_rev_8_21_14_0_10_42_18]|uniref:Uncharacterized protein n=1 Tax=Candidatus Doudnabacteria bacterium CG10_big_fil_rev_8_21_14_0_10_42_18 TaxID=1974552 RepID=A0A2H0VBM1_9BACT|nr:MAG: hypothetical protein COT92_00605 [Candidatus Doudnabacteria bacterium CG10_big_fil_rev_8_21_14_0_10_42_18]
MRENSKNKGLKKSLYLFLSSLLGVLLFLVLHRIVVFFYLYISDSGLVSSGNGLGYLYFLAIDYFTLIITLMLGAWYGIWLGIYWYEKVYEEGSHNGLAAHIVENYWPKKKFSGYRLDTKIKLAQKKLEADLWELEGLTKKVSVKSSTVPSPNPVKRKVVRKQAPKRLKKS